MTRTLLPLIVMALGVAPGSGSAGDARARPADLVDVGAIRALTLEDLEWKEESRREVAGATVLVGTWKGPRFAGYSSTFEAVDVDLREVATIYIPSGLPEGTALPQIVWAAHYEDYARVTYESFADLAVAAPVAFVVHGEVESDWTSLGFDSRDGLVGMTLFALALANPCEPQDYRFGNYLLALAETNLRGLTLLSRLIERERLTAGPAGIVGYSKEGFAAWFAAAVDDRLVAAAPGGWQIEDVVRGLTAEEEAWGCDGSIGGAVSGTVILAFRNWLVGSPGGDRALDYFSVDRFAGDLHPEFFLLHGDVGLYDMHDGIYWTPGAETHFLEGFGAASGKPFRYDRKPDHDVRESDMSRNERLTAILANYLVERDLAGFPEVVDARPEIDGSIFRVVAHASGEPSAMRAWWSHSSDPAFDDEGNAPWVEAPMALEGDAWVTLQLEIPRDEKIGWYVEAEGTLSWRGRQIVRRDATPQRFFGGAPPRSCPGVERPECTPFVRGDANADADLNISDPVAILRYLFLGGPDAPPCLDAADADDDGEVALTDAIWLLNHLFLGGPPPRDPAAECGTDSLSDELDCAAYPPCAGG